MKSGSVMREQRCPWTCVQRMRVARFRRNCMHSECIPQMELAAFRGPVLLLLYPVFRETTFKNFLCMIVVTDARTFSYALYFQWAAHS